MRFRTLATAFCLAALAAGATGATHARDPQISVATLQRLDRSQVTETGHGSIPSPPL